MTPEERWAAHEQWLRDHDLALNAHHQIMEELRATLRQMGAIQVQQGAVLLEVAHQLARLLDRDDDPRR